MLEDERLAIDSEFAGGHEVVEPTERIVPFVFCSPHSGSHYPEIFRQASRLDTLALRKSEDCFVDELFAQAVALGAPLLHARFPRAYLDVNREPYELDPELFGKALPSYANSQSVRVAGGLGTIARVVADGEAIYRSPPSLAAALVRIEMLYLPFHATLGRLIEETHERFGLAILIDCHSMPSAAMNQLGPGNRPDIVVGDRFGTSCDLRISRLVREQMSKLGYHVQMNRPYAGGYITEHYGRPVQNVHAVQIEVNRALYVDEQTLRPLPRFERLKLDLSIMMKRLIAEFSPPLPRRAAAE